MSRKRKDSKILTEVELEMMNILWRLRSATVNQVLDCLPKGRALAYTSVSTILRILEQKGMVHSEKVGRGHLYSAKLDKYKYEARSVSHMVQNVFNGEPLALVRRLIDTKGISVSDLAEIRSLLDQKETQ